MPRNMLAVVVDTEGDVAAMAAALRDGAKIEDTNEVFIPSLCAESPSRPANLLIPPTPTPTPFASLPG